MSVSLSREPVFIAVDLTPVLPGGENGGAKVFVLELLRQLAILAPRCRFLLLTRDTAHAELRQLDCSNIECRMVLHTPSVSAPILPAQQQRRVLPGVLPARIRRLAQRLHNRIINWYPRQRPELSLHALGVDLLYCPFSAPTYAEAGMPVVSTIYDLQYLSYPQFFAAMDVAHRAATFAAAMRDSTLVAAISDYARDSAVSHGGVDPEKIRTIYLRMARRLDEARQDDTGMLAGFGLEPGRYLIYPANFWQHKNHEMLLSAFGMALNEGLPKDTRLVCTGAQGARRDYLLAAASAMGLGRSVLFPGYVDEASLAQLLRNSAGMIFPSLYEGFGLPLIEAMAMEIPVACSNRTSLPEIAAGAALLFDPRVVAELAAAITTLVCDTARRAELIAAGRLRAREFMDSQRMAREYWQLFCDAARNRMRVSSISGVQADGWAGAQIVVDVVTGLGDASLELDLLLPDWTPHPSVRMEILSPGRWGRKRLRIARGNTLRHKMPVRPGRVSFSLAPDFVPADCGHGEDRRALSLMVLRCALRHAGGQVETLWQMEQP